MLDEYDFRNTGMKNKNPADLDHIFFLSLLEPKLEPKLILHYRVEFGYYTIDIINAIEFFVVRSATLTYSILWNHYQPLDHTI